MSLFIASLNSGSNGNCYYVGNATEAILVDAGISCKEIEKRMRRLQLTMEKVKAIFVSHEHSDHIKGIPVLAGKYRMPVYITRPTLEEGRLRIEEQQVKTFKAYEPVTIGGLTITAFPKFHDAADPYSFVVTSTAVRVGIFTDIGHPCEHLIHNFRQCHAAFLESNYDEEMLERSTYPRHLKNRIKGQHGHLSNIQALELFKRHRPSFMTHLLLSHLSQNNNCPALVQQLFDPHAEETNIIVASRFQETALYHICQEGKQLAAPRQPLTNMRQMQFSFV